MKTTVAKQTYNKYMKLWSLSIRDPKEYCQTMLSIPPEEWRKEYGSFLDAEIREMKYLCEAKEDVIEGCRQTIADAEKEIAEAKEEIKTTRNKLALFVKLQKSIKKQQRVAPQ